MERKDFFENFTSTATQVNLLKAGKNIPVKISRYVMTDSRHNFDGSDKDDLPEYEDATPQLAVVFVSTTGEGVITHRYNGQGFKKYSDLSAKDIQSGKFINIDGYACTKDRKGTLVRIEDEEKTKSCHSILSGLFNSLGLPEGSGMEDLDRAVQNEYTLAIDIVSEDYEGKEQLRVKRTRKVGEQSEAQKSLNTFSE